MQSDKQIAANRRNALRSTGPRTEAGKRSSRLNSYKHGLTAHLDPMSAEQQQARDAFIADLINGFQPVGPAEHELARSIAETRWRLNRVPLIESQLFAAADAPFPDDPAHLHLLTIYEMRLSRRAQSELRQLLSLQNARVAKAEREARRQSEETERRKNAEARHDATLETRRSAALAEAGWLVNLDEEEGKTIDPAGVFRHQNGFDFSNSLIREEIDHTARLAFAKTLFNRRIDDLKAKAATIKLPLAPPPSPEVPPGVPPGVPRQCFVNLR